MTKTALITGAAGQDGWYLIQRLLKHGYTVHAQSRQTPPADFPSGVAWHAGDLTDDTYLKTLVNTVSPDEIYNLAAVAQPALSWTIPRETAQLNAIVPQKLCELLLVRHPDCRMFQASSSEIFGDTTLSAQDEDSPRNPKSPYAIAKDYAHRIVGAYRRQFGLHLACGIMFNHESPRRPLAFVSQKIAHAAAAVSLGLSTTKELDERGLPLLEDGKLRLGNLSVRRDFGFAGDYVEIMHMILSSDTPDDYVIGTGEHHSIAEFCAIAFDHVGRDWKDHVIVDPSLVRKDDNHYTHADATKAYERFRWRPKTTFEGLVRMMVDARVEKLKAATDLRQ